MSVCVCVVCVVYEFVNKYIHSQLYTKYLIVVYQFNVCVFPIPPLLSHRSRYIGSYGLSALEGEMTLVCHYRPDPTDPALRVDETETLGGSMFGLGCSERLIWLRSVLWFSRFTFVASMLFVILASSLGIPYAYKTKMSTGWQAVRYFTWSLLPFGFWQPIQGTLRLNPTVMRALLARFDFWYLLVNIILLTVGGCFVFWDDSLVVCGWIFDFLAAFVLISADTQSQQSRNRSGRGTVIVGIILLVFILCLLNFTPMADSPNLLLPGSQWFFDNLGVRPSIYPSVFTADRVVTVLVFYIRFLVNSFRPGAEHKAMILSSPLIRTVKF